MKPLVIFLLGALVLVVVLLLRQRSLTRVIAAPSLTLEQADQRDTGTCEHCGHNSRVLTGYISRDGRTRAAYFVHWTLGISEHPANFDLIIGEWGEGTIPPQKFAVSLLYRNDAEQRGFMVIDATGRLFAKSAMVGRALTRVQVVGTPLATEVFELVDFILLNDPRVGTIETKPSKSASP